MSAFRLGALGGLLLAAACAAACGTLRAKPMDPLSAEEHNDLGIAYYARGEYGLATREFRRALALAPGFTLALVNLGDAHLALGEVDAAIVAYGQAHAQSPDSPAVANNLAWALLQHEHRWREAESLIREALARAPEPRGYYLDTLGTLLLRKAEPGPALEAFRGALADPGLRDRAVRAAVIMRAAEALARLGDPAGAARCQQVARALAVSPIGSETGQAGPDIPLSREVGPGESMC